MTTPVPNVAPHPALDWSGRPFAAPDPALLSKAWRIKNHHLGGDSLAATVSPTYEGQDAINPSGCTAGLNVYAGYANGTFANLNDFRSDFPDALYILAITPSGLTGPRCVDCEPGDVSVAEAAQFVKNSLPATSAEGRNDAGKPMVYCSAGDAQSVIDAVSALGISRDQWLLFSAHWIGSHICSPGACGYPDADATQYMDGDNYDSDLFYAYCFSTVWPLAAGAAGEAVETLQGNINAWISVLESVLGLTITELTVDGVYGPDTEAAVAIAQLYFKDTGPSGTCSEALYDDLTATPVAPVPVPTPAVLCKPPVDLTVTGAGPHSVAFTFRPPSDSPVQVTQYQVSICEGDVLGPVIGTYPRYIQASGADSFSEQFGGVEPGTQYILAVRSLNGSGSASTWATAVFETAAS